MNKVKILEERTVKCAYGTFAKEVIVDDGIRGRLLVSDAFDYSSMGAGAVRWEHGRVIQPQPTDTFDTLGGDWNETTTILRAVYAGYDQERPVLEWPGPAISQYARAHID